MLPSRLPERPSHAPAAQQPGSATPAAAPTATPQTEPSLRVQALQALCECDPGRKVVATHDLWQRCLASGGAGAASALLLPSAPGEASEGVPDGASEEATEVAPKATPQEATEAAPGLAMEHALQAAGFTAALDPVTVLQAPEGALPGRPGRPLLVPPDAVPRRSAFTPQGLAALLHAVCHIEFNAINLALDAVWRFAGMPSAYYRDWLRVADEEATHFGLLRDHLRRLGADYGDFDAHDGLWEMCLKTQHDITARMALVPRTLEARGLDATPPMQARLRQVGTPAALRAVDILDTILRDEVGHVAIGNHWYGWLCARQRLDPLAHYRALSRQHRAPRLRPPFNRAARRAAGFSAAELAELDRSTEAAHAAGTAPSAFAAGKHESALAAGTDDSALAAGEGDSTVAAASAPAADAAASAAATDQPDAL